MQFHSTVTERNKHTRARKVTYNTLTFKLFDDCSAIVKARTSPIVVIAGEPGNGQTAVLVACLVKFLEQLPKSSKGDRVYIHCNMDLDHYFAFYYWLCVRLKIRHKITEPMLTLKEKVHNNLRKRNIWVSHDSEIRNIPKRNRRFNADIHIRVNNSDFKIPVEPADLTLTRRNIYNVAISSDQLKIDFHKLHASQVAVLVKRTSTVDNNFRDPVNHISGTVVRSKYTRVGEQFKILSFKV